MADRFNGFQFNGTKLDGFDFERIGKKIGIHEDVMRAVMQTEAAGKSTDSKGRIKALYEPHVAFRDSHGKVRDALVGHGLAYPKWRKGYPADSYPRINQARAVDETVALKATSWGFPQLLGENFALAGYDSVQDMVADFLLDEDNQLEGMVNFIKSAGLDDELRAIEAKVKKNGRVTADDCRAFVRGYNGTSYEKNNYHAIFAQNLNKWAKIADKASAPAAFMSTAVGDHAQADTDDRPDEDDNGVVDVGVAIGFPGDFKYKDGKYHKELEAVQRRLDELGYPEVGKWDGTWGSRTQAAILAFRADNGMPTVPDIDAGFLAGLMTAEHRPESPDRTTATVADLRAEGAEDIKAADNSQIAGSVLTGGGVIAAGGTVLDKADAYGGLLKRAADIVEPIQGFIQDNLWLLLIGGGGLIVWQSGVLKNIRLLKHQTGQDVSR